MKDNRDRVLKNCLIILGAILICMGMVWLVDQVFNGVFKEWFYNRFYYVVESKDYANLGHLNWRGIKNFFVIIFISFIIILVLCTGLTTYFYHRYRSKKDITYVANSMSSIMGSNSYELTMPKRFFEIESQLIKIGTTSQKNEQLVQMEMQRKNDLITYLAHDLKTPLASVIGYLSLLDEAQDMPVEQKAKYVGIALKKAYRLEELINEFFEITRFNLQSIVLNRGKIKLAFMLYQMADEFYPMLAPQGKQVDIHVPDDLMLVGDADKLARVFNNVLKNAIAYSYENSKIEISAVKHGEDVVITFTNLGDPIPSHKLETIFDKFYRLDSARSANTGGAGLGLAISKEIITAHGGSIMAESSMENTVFIIKLPS